MARQRYGRRAFIRGLGVSTLGVSLAGCLGRGSGSPTRIGMTNDLAYEPVEVSVDVGTTVTWRNTSDIVHTVTAYGDGIPEEADYFASGAFDSEAAARARMSDGLLATGDTFTHTFDIAGTYAYYCIPHEAADMTGTVRVG